MKIVQGSEDFDLWQLCELAKKNGNYQLHQRNNCDNFSNIIPTLSLHFVSNNEDARCEKSKNISISMKSIKLEKASPSVKTNTKL